MKCLTHCYTNQGDRKKNEDFAAYSYPGRTSGVWAVADGVGGAPGGEVAARVAVERALHAYIKQPALTPDRLADVFLKTNTAIRTLAAKNEELCGMRTTLAVLCYHRRHIMTAHVGDSRVYLFRKGKWMYQTRDHSVTQLALEIGGKRIFADRGELTRAMGDPSDYLPELSEVFHVRRGDAFLLCTDGFWGNLSQADLEETLQQSDTPEAWMQALCARHQACWTERQDNLTAITGMIR